MTGIPGFFPEEEDPVFQMLRENGWDGKRSEVDPMDDSIPMIEANRSEFVKEMYDPNRRIEAVAFTDKPEHLSPWIVAQGFVDMIDRSLEKEKLQTERPFTDFLDRFDGVKWYIDHKFRKLLDQPRSPEVPWELHSYAQGRSDGYDQMRSELAHNLLKVYMFEEIAAGKDPAEIAIDEAVSLGYLCENPEDSSQYMLTMAGIIQMKDIGDRKIVQEMVEGWWNDAAVSSEGSEDLRKEAIDQIDDMLPPDCEHCYTFIGHRSWCIQGKPEEVAAHNMCYVGTPQDQKKFAESYIRAWRATQKRELRGENDHPPVRDIEIVGCTYEECPRTDAHYHRETPDGHEIVKLPQVQPDVFTDGEGSIWSRTPNGKYWCGNLGTDEGGYTKEEVEAKFGLYEEKKEDPLVSLIAGTQEEAEDEASQQAIVQQHVSKEE